MPHPLIGHFTTEAEENIYLVSNDYDWSHSTVFFLYLEGKSPCSPNPCLNSGECNEREENFICVCRSEFKGDLCQEKGIDMKIMLCLRLMINKLLLLIPCQTYRGLLLPSKTALFFQTEYESVKFLRFSHIFSFELSSSFKLFTISRWAPLYSKSLPELWSVLC